MMLTILIVVARAPEAEPIKNIRLNSFPRKLIGFTNPGIFVKHKVCFEPPSVKTWFKIYKG